jgi:hypothetical protein
MMMIIQFMGRLARPNRDQVNGQRASTSETDKTYTRHGRYLFNSILLNSDVHSGKGLISPHSVPVLRYNPTPFMRLHHVTSISDVHLNMDI